MNQTNHPKFSIAALTMGDPAGIGLELALSAWLMRNDHALKPFVLFADEEVVRQRAREVTLNVPLAVIDDLDLAAQTFSTHLPLVQITVPRKVVAGKPDPANASAVIASIETALSHVRQEQCCAIVTNPIAKSVLYNAGFSHPGHTEFLATLAGARSDGTNYRPVMMLCAGSLRVIPATIHIPVRDVPHTLTPELIIETVQITYQALRNDFAITAPRVVLTGLNPHAGEDGAIGDEEERIIKPAIAQLRADGINVRGPLPADTLFHKTARKTYDAAVAMYHDQALIPLKTIAFDEGINTTLGLPFVRTSPDHGTAFDIAGTGTASPMSLIAAVKLAHRQAENRAALADRITTEVSA